MIPIRDVIPSRTTPVVTISLIALNVLVFLFQSSLSERGLDAVPVNFALVPADFSLVTVVHGDVPARRPRAPRRQPAVLVDLRRQHRRPPRPRAVRVVLPDLRLCRRRSRRRRSIPTRAVPMVGASGAIAGVMGAYLVLFPHSRIVMLFPFPPIVFELPAVLFLVMWFGIQFLNGIGTLPMFGAARAVGRRGVLGPRDGVRRRRRAGADHAAARARHGGMVGHAHAHRRPAHPMTSYGSRPTPSRDRASAFRTARSTRPRASRPSSA